MRVGIPKEQHPGERRVAGTPDTVAKLQKLGFTLLVESGAGQAAGFADEQFERAGCRVVAGLAELMAEADIVLQVRPPSEQQLALFREGQVLVSFLWPAQNKDLLAALGARKVTALAMDQIPRITRAQKMDALSSMANVAGYRAVIEAANHFPRFFTGQITAAGKIPPAKVLVNGAGVAGLAAIGAARGLGAIVRAFDVRTAVREQIESMGAEFLQVEIEEEGEGGGGYAKEMSEAYKQAQADLFLAQAKEVDVIVTTALIPGKGAPKVITTDMVRSMKPGSVIVDLVAEHGGNCELTRPGEIVVENGVTVVGYTDLPSRMASQSSQLYGMNLVHLLTDMGGKDNWKVDLEDEVVRGALVLHLGELTWPAPKPAAPAQPPAATQAAAAAPVMPQQRKSSSTWLGFAGLALLAVGLWAPPSFLSHLTVFVLACFVGWQVIWNVTPALHTPLMSVTNAISGIIIIGGMLQISGPLAAPTTILGAIAILIATINIAGGFLVTQRMLQMFRR